MTADSAAARAVTPWLTRMLAAVGEPVVSAARWLAFTAALGAAVIAHAARAGTWRRPVRTAFVAALYESGVRGIAAVSVAAALIGLAMVFQALYWLGALGQQALIGPLLTTVLVREVAPIVVGLIVVGRSGTATAIALGALARDGQIRMLDAQGIDPLFILVLPRTLAAAVAGFSLTMIFVLIALVTGWAAARWLSSGDLGLLDAFDQVLRAMGASNFVLLPLKGILIGFVVSLVPCAIVLGAPELAATPTRLVSLAFSFMVLATLLVSGAISLVL